MLALALALAQAAPVVAPTSEAFFEHHRDSVFTIELHTGGEGSRSSLGSGYLVDAAGTLVTNYHVVASFIEDPERYRIRARSRSGEVEVRLIAFDLVNDLALLSAPGASGAPLHLAETGPVDGASLVAFGDPLGLGLSVVEGRYNGSAPKGVVDRMRLSMPLNPGMSGGPILSGDGRVVGTNVSIVRGSNSLSFGVPLEPLKALLAGPRLGDLTPDVLRAETGRQLLALEARTAERLTVGMAEQQGETVSFGRALAGALPDFFECWDDSETDETRGLSVARRGCSLQFTPSLETTGAVSAVDLQLQHRESVGGSWGFYGHLASVASARHDVSSTAPDADAPRSAPSCVVDRVRAGGLVWSVNTCVQAYRRYPGLFDLSLVAVSVDRGREALVLDVSLRGFRLETCLWLSRHVLEDVRLPEAG